MFPWEQAQIKSCVFQIQVRVLKIDAVSQMRVEYQNAIVHQARVQQAQRLWEEAQKKTNELEDAVKSAMCPFLVLEVRRDNLIEDTLNQINLKVIDLIVFLCLCFYEMHREVEPKHLITPFIRPPCSLYCHKTPLLFRSIGVSIDSNVLVFTCDDLVQILRAGCLNKI